MLDEDSGANDCGDSLFGSPPPSPSQSRGRSPSPVLALPSSRNCIGSLPAQNVGTIALPGSHAYSKDTVNPLALSLSGLTAHLRPPAQPIRLESATNGASAARPPSSVRAKRKTSPSATPRPDPPPILLPGPDEPIPPNLLRNQPALLGLAGMVGGVNPSRRLVPPRMSGSTVTNPIVIEEDEHDPPPLGHGQNTLEIDANRLPPPPAADVLASLIQQKNVFPILHSIFTLISGAHAVPQGSEPPSKRRKLGQVPAGAADWDVPYPLMESAVYRTNWERERGKQLIMQLATVLKSAAKKAATRTYAKEIGLQSKKRVTKPKQKSDSPSPESPKVNGHYRPVTMTYGLGMSSDMDIQFDDLVATLMAMSPSPPLDDSSPSVFSQVAGSSTSDQSQPAAVTAVPEPRYKRYVAGPGRPPSALLKEEILTRAKERRRQLAAEIERAKVELWEATIEQGVLSQLSKEI